MPKFYRMLKQGGSILVLYMAWLPFEDEIAGASKKLVLKYNPKWSGAGETKILYNRLKQLNLCGLFSQTVMKHILTILVSVFSSISLERQAGLWASGGVRDAFLRAY
jgi:hypothetical protein